MSEDQFNQTDDNGILDGHEYYVGDQVIFTGYKVERAIPARISKWTKCYIVSIQEDQDANGGFIYGLNTDKTQPNALADAETNEIMPVAEDEDVDDERADVEAGSVPMGEAVAETRKVIDPEVTNESPKVTAEEEVEKCIEECGSEGNAIIFLREKTYKADFILAGVLSRVKNDGSYKRSNNPKFGDYVQATYGIHPRRAEELVKIYETFSSYGLNSTDFARIGFAKSREVGRAIKGGKDVLALLEYAEEHTIDEVSARVSTELVEAGVAHGNTQVVATKLRLTLYEDQLSVLLPSWVLALKGNPKYENVTEESLLGNSNALVDAMMHLAIQYSGAASVARVTDEIQEAALEADGSTLFGGQ